MTYKNQQTKFPFLTLPLLISLSENYGKEHVINERFGQYVMNRTSFKQDEYDNVNIFYEENFFLVFNALTKYCIDTCNL